MPENTLRKWTLVKYLVAIFNFIASLCSIVGTVYTIYSDTINNNLIWVWIIAGSIFLIGFLTFIIAIRSEKADYDRKTTMYATSMHEILHFIRDRRKELDNLYDRNGYMNEQDFIRMITVDNIEIMNKLSSILSSIIDSKVRSCIKLIDFTKANESDYNNMNLITFARSGKEGVIAALSEHNKTIKVSENTDFETIFAITEVYEENRKHYFYEKDLKKYDKLLKKSSNNAEYYKNSDKKWNKKYNTAIVMPMRYLKESDQDAAVYDIVGFLCVDAKQAGAFEKENLYFILEYLKGIADIMYSYLNSCIIYYNKLRTTTQEERNGI